MGKYGKHGEYDNFLDMPLEEMFDDDYDENGVPKYAKNIKSSRDIEYEDHYTGKDIDDIDVNDPDTYISEQEQRQEQKLEKKRQETLKKYPEFSPDFLEKKYATNAERVEKVKIETQVGVSRPVPRAIDHIKHLEKNPYIAFVDKRFWVRDIDIKATLIPMNIFKDKKTGKLSKVPFGTKVTYNAEGKMKHSQLARLHNKITHSDQANMNHHFIAHKEHDEHPSYLNKDGKPLNDVTPQGFSEINKAQKDGRNMSGAMFRKNTQGLPIIRFRGKGYLVDNDGWFIHVYEKEEYESAVIDGYSKPVDFENSLIGRHVIKIYQGEELEDEGPEKLPFLTKVRKIVDKGFAEIMIGDNLYKGKDGYWSINGKNSASIQDMAVRDIDKAIKETPDRIRVVSSGGLYPEIENADPRSFRIENDMTVKEFLQQSKDYRDVEGLAKFQIFRKFTNRDLHQKQKIINDLKLYNYRAYYKYMTYERNQAYAMVADKYSTIDIDYDFSQLDSKRKGQVKKDLLDMFASMMSNHVVVFDNSVNHGMRIFYKSSEKSRFSNSSDAGKIIIDGIEMKFDVRMWTTGVGGFTTLGYGAYSGKHTENMYFYSPDKNRVNQYRNSRFFIPSKFDELAFRKSSMTVINEPDSQYHRMNAANHETDINRLDSYTLNPKFFEDDFFFSFPEGSREESIFHMIVMFYNRTHMTKDEVVEYFDKHWEDDYNAKDPFSITDIANKVEHVFSGSYNLTSRMIDDLSSLFEFKINKGGQKPHSERFNYNKVSQTEAELVHMMLSSENEEDLEGTEFEKYALEQPKTKIARTHNGLHVIAAEFKRILYKLVNDTDKTNEHWIDDKIKLSGKELSDGYYNYILRGPEQDYFKVFENKKSFAYKNARTEMQRLSSESFTAFDLLSLAYYKLTHQGRIHTNVWSERDLKSIRGERVMSYSRQLGIADLALPLILAHAKDVMKKKSLTDMDLNKMTERAENIIDDYSINHNALVLLPVEDFFVMMSVSVKAGRGRNGGYYFSLSQDSEFWQAMSIIFRDIQVSGKYGAQTYALRGMRTTVERDDKYTVINGVKHIEKQFMILDNDAGLDDLNSVDKCETVDEVHLPFTNNHQLFKLLYKEFSVWPSRQMLSRLQEANMLKIKKREGDLSFINDLHAKRVNITSGLDIKQEDKTNTKVKNMLTLESEVRKSKICNNYSLSA